MGINEEVVHHNLKFLSGWEVWHGDWKYLVDQSGEETINKRHIVVIHIYPENPTGITQGHGSVFRHLFEKGREPPTLIMSALVAL